VQEFDSGFGAIENWILLSDGRELKRIPFHEAGSGDSQVGGRGCMD